MQDKFQGNNGYILIESIVAITIVVIGLLGIFSLLSRSLSLNRVVADRFVAAYLAAEGIELVKNVIDNNILAGKPWNAGFSQGDHEADFRSSALEQNQNRLLRLNSVSGAYGYGESDATRIGRVIHITMVPDSEGIINEIIIGSSVNWTTRGGGKFHINLEEHIFNWR